MKKYSIKKVRDEIKKFKYDDMGYPEWNENGKCTWDFGGFCDLSENDMMKLIDEEIIVYFMIEDRYVPISILNADTQEWRV